MKITPLSSTGTALGAVSMGQQQAAPVQTTRTLRMATNATPGRGPEEDLPILAPSEATTTETASEDEANKPLSPQLAAIAKHKRALQVKERELQAREEALKSKPSTQEGGLTIADLKADPIGQLLKAGLTYDDLAQAVISRQDGGNPDMALMERKLEDLEKGFDQKLSDRDAQAEKQALAEMQREATLLAKDEAFELVNATGAIPDVMRLIERTYRETGEVLDVKEAMSAVEEELLADALKKAQFRKVQDRFAPQPAQPQAAQQRPMRTLTNRDTASVPMSAKARALAAFNGTLKR